MATGREKGYYIIGYENGVVIFWVPFSREVLRLRARADRRRKEMAGWISVNKRSPKDGDDVLTWSSAGGYATGYFSARSRIWFNHTGHRMSMEPTHWMPLPASPKEEK